jgi:AcrR family transcriptional regulator
MAMPVAKRALYEAALELFQESGFDGTSVQTIVEKAGVTKGAFYYYYDSKEALLLQMHDRLVDYALRSAEEIRALNLPPRETLVALIASQFRMVDTHLAEMTVFLQQQRHLTGALFEQVKGKRDRWEAILEDTIDEGVRAGAFRSAGPTRIVAFAIAGMVSWAYQWWRSGRELSADDVAAIFADMVCNGLTPRDV